MIKDNKSSFSSKINKKITSTFIIYTLILLFIVHIVAAAVIKSYLHENTLPPESMNFFILHLVAGIIFFGLVFSGFLFFLRHQIKKDISQPIDYILSYLQKIKNGKKPSQAYMNNDEFKTILDEFEQLYENFNRSIQALQDSQERIKNSAGFKTNILKILSHEIKTPLQSIIGFSEHLKSKLSDKMQLQMLEVMTDSSKELLAKFDRLIERSYLEENSINKFMLLEDFNPDNLILELSSKYENLCFKKGLSFHFVQNHFNYDEKNIFVDGKKLRRILEELLDNAVKFTDTGDIWFEFNAQESFFDFSIQDSGSGINQEDIDRLSGSFSSSTRNILTRKTEGLGIGLSIVKDYTEILGGAVSFQKKKNGTLVSLKIPLALTMEKIWYYDLKKDFTKFSMQGFDTIGELNSYNTDLKGVMSYIKKQFEEYQSIDISSKKTFVTKALTDLLRLSKEKNLKTLEKITLQILSILKSDKDAYAYDLLDTLYKRINFSFSE